jgi:hypothetical protein
MHQDVDFINADVVCFNSLKGAKMVYEKSLEFWTNHAEQGGMKYCYQNQESLDIKVDIVDFPYAKSPFLYNVRSKGTACGGNQMYKGNLYSGNYKDPNNVIVGNVYPTYEYYIKDNKLFTKDHKQIKVFHYAEALGVKTKEEYNETLYEIKNKWFNPETIEFNILSILIFSPSLATTTWLLVGWLGVRLGLLYPATPMRSRMPAASRTFIFYNEQT